MQTCIEWIDQKSTSDVKTVDKASVTVSQTHLEASQQGVHKRIDNRNGKSPNLKIRFQKAKSKSMVYNNRRIGARNSKNGKFLFISPCRPKCHIEEFVDFLQKALGTWVGLLSAQFLATIGERRRPVLKGIKAPSLPPQAIRTLQKIPRENYFISYTTMSKYFKCLPFSFVPFLFSCL